MSDVSNKENRGNRLPTALLTGGTGFIGSNLARSLVRDGWDVHLITRPQSRLDSVRDIKSMITQHVFHGETVGMSGIMQEIRPDIIFHLASYFRAEHVSDDVVPMLNSNLVFGTQLLEAMANAGVRAIVNTGTAWQHYEGKEYSPACLYAATKHAFEALMQFYIEAYGISAVTLKLTDTYGPDDPRPKLLNLIRKAAAEGTTLQMSPGEQRIDFVHVDAVVKALRVAANLLLRGTSVGHAKYWVSSGNQQRLRDFVEEFVRTEKLNIVINWGGRNYRRREMMDLIPVHPEIGTLAQ